MCDFFHCIIHCLYKTFPFHSTETLALSRISTSLEGGVTTPDKSSGPRVRSPNSESRLFERLPEERHLISVPPGAHFILGLPGVSTTSVVTVFFPLSLGCFPYAHHFLMQILFIHINSGFWRKLSGNNPSTLYFFVADLMRTFSVLAFLLITFSGCSSQTLHPSLLPGNYWPASLASAFADTAFATSQLDGTLTPGSCVLQINFGSCSIATAPISLSDCVKAAGISNVVVFTSTNALSFTLSPTDVCTIPSIVLFAEIGGISTQFVAANPLNGGVVVYGRPTVNSITMSPVGFFGSAEQTITIPGFLYGSAGVYNVSLGLVPTGDGSSCVSAPTVTAVVPVSEMQLRVSFIVSTDNDGCNVRSHLTHLFSNSSLPMLTTCSLDHIY